MNMHSEDALSANGGSSITQKMCSGQSAGAEFVWTICSFWFPIDLALKQLFKAKSSCYAHFRLSNRGETPTNRFYSLDLVRKYRFANSLSSHFSRNCKRSLSVSSFFLHWKSNVQVGMYIDFSAVASFPASLWRPDSLGKRLVKQEATSLIPSSDEYFVLSRRMSGKHNVLHITGPPEAICGWSGPAVVKPPIIRAQSTPQNFGPSYF